MLAIWIFLGISACSTCFVAMELSRLREPREPTGSMPRSLIDIRRSAMLDFKGFRERQEARVAEAITLLGVEGAHAVRVDIEDHIYDFLESGFGDEQEELERLHSLVEMELRR